MAHKTLIGGTAYEISGGKTLVNSTSYEIDKGKTLVGGTSYDIDFNNICYVTFGFTYSDNVLDALKAGTRLKDCLDLDDYTNEAKHTYITINGVNYNTGYGVDIPVIKGSYIHFYIESDRSDEKGYLRVFRKNGEVEKLAEGKFHYDLLVDSDLDIMMDTDQDFANFTWRVWWMAQVFYR